jgi:very-short-patch-repair endonuclease
MTAQNNWTAIKRHYADLNLRINACASNEWAVDPYSWDMGKNMIVMTPIEENFWADCREADLILYPQYPACGYFIDFANPAAKVGIECDGKAFHMDKERDALRQSVLEKAGWTIYRITGKECNENWDENGVKPPFGRVLADHIGSFHGIKRMRSKDQVSGARHVGEIAVDGMTQLFQQILGELPDSKAGESA